MPRAKGPGKGGTTATTPADSNAVESNASNSKKKTTKSAEEKLQKAIHNAKSKNPTGVLIVENNLPVNQCNPALAGYLGLANTSDLRALLDTINAYPFVKQWVDGRKKGFGMTGKDESWRVSGQLLFKFLVNENEVIGKHLDADLPLSTVEFPPDNSDFIRGYASWIVVMHRIIKAHQPQLAIQKPATDPDRPMHSKMIPQMYYNIEAENWYRAYCVLRAVWRTFYNPSRQAQGKNEQNKAAFVPYYLVEGDFRNVTSKEGGALSRAGQELEDWAGDEEHEYFHDSEEDEALDDKEREELEARLDAILARSHKGNPIKMPDLDKDAQKVLMKSIGRTVNWLYGGPPKSNYARYSDDEDDDGDDEPAADDTEGGAHDKGREHLAEMEAEGVIITEDGEVKANASREEFWKLQKQMNQVSSQPPPHAECCVDLRLDPTKPTFGGRLLMPWQPTGIWWVLYMWLYGLGTALLGDDVGLGKTLTALAALVFGVMLAENRSKEGGLDLGLKGPYKPTIILTPALAFGVWRKEMEPLMKGPFAIKLHIWAGSQAKNEVGDRDLTLDPDPDALRRFCNSFDENDPKTALNVILTTMQTFQMRTVSMNDEGSEITKGKRAIDFDEEEDLNNDEDEPLLAEEKIRLMSSRVAGCFGVAIVDEAHMAKSVRTRIHQSIRLAKFSNLLAITATVTINRTVDLQGQLEMIDYHLLPELRQHRDQDRNEGDGSKITKLELSDYESEWNSIRQRPKLTAVNQVDFKSMLKYLDAGTFRRCISGKDTVDANSIVLPLVLGTIQLRRVKGQSMEALGETVIIGREVPHFEVTTIELQQGRSEAKQYIEHYKEQMARRDTDSVGGFATTSHRTVCHATVHPGLANLGKRKDFATKEILAWNQRDDYGYRLFHRTIAHAPSHVSGRDRASALKSMTADSVKLRALVARTYDICVKMGENLLIYFGRPGSQWAGEITEHLANVPVLSLRSSHTRRQRMEIVDRFNDADTKGIVLITNVLCGATSLNLQSNCHHVIFVEPCESANIMAQAIGRVHRIGQTKVQHIEIFTTVFTYDGLLQARAASKMYNQLAGTSNIDVSQDEIDKEVAKLKLEPSLETPKKKSLSKAKVSKKDEDEDAAEVDDTVEEDDDDEELVRTAVSCVKERKVIVMYTGLYGQRTPKHELGNLFRPMGSGSAENFALAEIYPSAKTLKLYQELTDYLTGSSDRDRRRARYVEGVNGSKPSAFERMMPRANTAPITLALRPSQTPAPETEVSTNGGLEDEDSDLGSDELNEWLAEDNKGVPANIGASAMPPVKGAASNNMEMDTSGNPSTEEKSAISAVASTTSAMPPVENTASDEMEVDPPADTSTKKFANGVVEPSVEPDIATPSNSDANIMSNDHPMTEADASTTATPKTATNTGESVVPNDSATSNGVVNGGGPKPMIPKLRFKKSKPTENATTSNHTLPKPPGNGLKAVSRKHKRSEDATATPNDDPNEDGPSPSKKPHSETTGTENYRPTTTSIAEFPQQLKEQYKAAKATAADAKAKATAAKPNDPYKPPLLKVDANNSAQDNTEHVPDHPPQTKRQTRQNAKAAADPHFVPPERYRK